MLADWRISMATFQQRTKPDGSNVDYAEYVLQRKGAACQKVILESPSRIGLPTAGDEDVIIALLVLAKQQNFESDIVRFIPSRLLQIMGLTDTQKNYVRLKKALKRLRAVTITYELTWYSRKTQSVEPILITGILAEVKLVFRRGRRASGSVPDSHVQWTRNFYTSLQEGNLTDLDLDLYFGWRRPCSKHLHRHLNKVWHAGKKPKTYERDLRELACGHLGMTDNKDLKRNFHLIIDELERQEYLLPVDKAIRYRKVRPGVWRVQLEIHPDRCRGKSAGVGDSSRNNAPTPQNDAVALVSAYHSLRFGREAYIPKLLELKHAQALLRDHDGALLLNLLPTVAKTVENSYRGQDCHFGAAVPHFESALQEQIAKTSRCAHQAEKDADHSTQQAELIQGARAKQQIRSARLSQWQKLSPQQQSTFYEQAVVQATSGSVRSRLCRRRNLQDPATEVLALMAREFSPSRGEST